MTILEEWDQGKFAKVSLYFAGVLEDFYDTLIGGPDAWDRAKLDRHLKLLGMYIRAMRKVLKE